MYDTLDIVYIVILYHVPSYPSISPPSSPSSSSPASLLFPPFPPSLPCPYPPLSRGSIPSDFSRWAHIVPLGAGRRGTWDEWASKQCALYLTPTWSEVQNIRLLILYTVQVGRLLVRLDRCRSSVVPPSATLAGNSNLGAMTCVTAYTMFAVFTSCMSL